MAHIHGARDVDLHNPDGSHIGTARTANGRDVEQHERRIRAHLDAHRAASVVPWLHICATCHGRVPEGKEGIVQVPTNDKENPDGVYVHDTNECRRGARRYPSNLEQIIAQYRQEDARATA